MDLETRTRPLADSSQTAFGTDEYTRLLSESPTGERSFFSRLRIFFGLDEEYTEEPLQVADLEQPLVPVKEDRQVADQQARTYTGIDDEFDIEQIQGFYVSLGSSSPRARHWREWSGWSWFSPWAWVSLCRRRNYEAV